MLPGEFVSAVNGLADKCERPTRSGNLCKNYRLRVIGWHARQIYEAPACQSHMTSEERAEFQARQEAIGSGNNAAQLAYFASVPVACHAWPVTDEHRHLAELFRTSDDPDKAEEIAWGLLANWQQGKCGICGMHSEVMDHDHETGMVRGWLCRFCNANEGHNYIPGSQYNRYRQMPPTKILGIEIVYYSPFGWTI